MQRRIIGLAVLLAIAIASWSAGAYSESAQATYNAGTPMDAYVVESERLGEMNLLRLSAATGETMLMLIDSAGMPICLTTEKSAPADPDAEQTADDAIATALGAFPDAIILQVYSDEMYKAVNLATPELIGTLWVVGGQICRRELRGGHFIADGRLTLDGACHAARLLHPEAELMALEYDSDDNTYDGDALVNGVEYEIELDARTGMLLEWERD